MPTKKYALKVYLSDEELKSIMKRADKVALSLSCFAKQVCLEIPVSSRGDQQARLDLIEIYSELQSLGGLLKQSMDNGPDKDKIHSSLRKIDQALIELKKRIVDCRRP